MQKWDYLYLELVLNDVEWINGNKIQKIPMFATSHKAWDVLKLLGQDGYESGWYYQQSEHQRVLV